MSSLLGSPGSTAHHVLFPIFAPTVIMPLRTLLASLVLANILVHSGTATSQDPFSGDPLGAADNDPFDDAAGDPFGGAGPFAAGALDTAAVGAAEEPVQWEPSNPFVVQLLARSGRGTNAAADAIAALTRTRHWQAVDQLLNTAAGQVTTDAAKAQMGRRIGAAALLQITGQDEISEASRQFASELARAASQQKETPEQLAAAIDAIDAESVDRQLAALRTVLAGGNEAIAALVQQVVSANPSANRDDLLRTLLRMGDGGPEALRQLALYAAPAQRMRALQALVRINPDAVISELVTALHASDITVEERQFAAEVLARLTTAPPSRGQAMAFLLHQLREKQADAAAALNDEHTATQWTVRADGSGVSFVNTRRILKAYRQASDAAAMLRRLGPLPSDAAEAAINADLAYRVMIDPQWGLPEQIETVRQRFTDQISAAGLSAAIADALDRHDTPALVGLLRLLRGSVLTGDASAGSLTLTDRDQLLRGTGAEPTPLVQAASSSPARVRYEAAEAILRLRQTGEATTTALLDGPLAGGPRVQRTLTEMRSLQERPTAIVVETRPQVTQHLESLLSRLGYRVETVPTVGSLLRRVVQGGDIQLILSKAQLADLPPIELVDRVRRMEVGRTIPIAFYDELGSEADPEAALQSLASAQPIAGFDSVAAATATHRWDAVTIRIPLPKTPAGLLPLYEQLDQNRRLPPLSALDRRLYRDAASDAVEEAP